MELGMGLSNLILLVYFTSQPQGMGMAMGIAEGHGCLDLGLQILSKRLLFSVA